jgi:hypothetical protein
MLPLPLLSALLLSAVVLLLPAWRCAVLRAHSRCSERQTQGLPLPAWPPALLPRLPACLPAH